MYCAIFHPLSKNIFHLQYNIVMYMSLHYAKSRCTCSNATKDTIFWGIATNTNVSYKQHYCPFLQARTADVCFSSMGNLAPGIGLKSLEALSKKIGVGPLLSNSLIKCMPNLEKVIRDFGTNCLHLQINCVKGPRHSRESTPGKALYFQLCMCLVLQFTTASSQPSQWD